MGSFNQTHRVKHTNSLISRYQGWRRNYSGTKEASGILRPDDDDDDEDVRLVGRKVEGGVWVEGRTLHHLSIAADVTS